MLFAAMSFRLVSSLSESLTVSEVPPRGPNGYDQYNDRLCQHLRGDEALGFFHAQAPALAPPLAAAWEGTV